MTNSEVVFYADPKIWTVAISLVALFVSLLPYLKRFKRGKLKLDIYENGWINHKLGNPNMQLHLILSNTSGKTVVIKKINTKLELDGKLISDIRGQSYIRFSDNNAQVILTKFKIKPGDEWGHTINFFNNLSRTDEKAYKSIIKKVKNDIVKKLNSREAHHKSLVETTPDLIKKMDDLFSKNFKWEAGEYKLTITIDCQNQKSNITETFWFTLFESESDELKEYSNNYKHGEGVYYESKEDLGLNIRLSEKKS